MERDIERTCIDCAAQACNGNGDVFPQFCLTTENADSATLDKSVEAYEAEGTDREIMLAAAQIEHDFYCKMTRVEETVEFAKRMGYRKIGIATCAGLLTESRALARVLRSHGFEVFGIACKTGAVRKSDIGIPPECEEVGRNICNPINQALRLNEEQVDLNIVVGLCVGHDALFNKYAEAPVTTLVVKDRVTGNNPVAPLYSLDMFYHKILGPEQ